jgi:putative oxidoreductase
MKYLFASNDRTAHWSGLILRATLSLVLFPHGAQLFLGWFGGFGFSASMNYFTETESLPWLVGLSVILLQFFGALLILSGLLTRAVAAGLTGLFIGMIATSHWEYGFFMNWMGTQKGEGFEFHVLAIGLSLALMIFGPGKYSLDEWISKRIAGTTKHPISR